LDHLVYKTFFIHAPADREASALWPRLGLHLVAAGPKIGRGGRDRGCAWGRVDLVALIAVVGDLFVWRASLSSGRRKHGHGQIGQRVGVQIAHCRCRTMWRGGSGCLSGGSVIRAIESARGAGCLFAGLLVRPGCLLCRPSGPRDRGRARRGQLVYRFFYLLGLLGLLVGRPSCPRD